MHNSDTATNPITNANTGTNSNSDPKTNTRVLSVRTNMCKQLKSPMR